MKVEHSAEEAKKLGEQQAMQQLNLLINGNVVNHTTDITEHESYYDVTVDYDVIEEIGTKEKLNTERMG